MVHRLEAVRAAIDMDMKGVLIICFEISQVCFPGELCLNYSKCLPHHWEMLMAILLDNEERFSEIS